MAPATDDPVWDTKFCRQLDCLPRLMPYNPSTEGKLQTPLPGQVEVHYNGSLCKFEGEFATGDLCAF